MNMLDLCVHPKCGKEVRPRQQALLCDNCGRWQHRICHTGIKQSDYFVIQKRLKATEKGKDDFIFFWTCVRCPPPG